MSQILISVIGGLGGMFGWGIADFFANTIAEKIGNVRLLKGVLIVASFIAGTLVLMTGSFPSVEQFTPLTIVLTIVMSAGFLLGFLFLYKAFEIGAASVVLPIVATNPVFAITVGILVFGQPFFGMQLGLVAFVIIGSILMGVDFSELKKDTQSKMHVGVKEALISSLGFGVLFFPTSEFLAEQMGWMYVSFMANIGALILLTGLVFFVRSFTPSTPAAYTKPILWTIVIIAILDVCAHFSVNYGLEHGFGFIVFPISQTAMMLTVLLAVVFLKERLKPIQILGTGMILTGVIILSILS